MQPAQYGARDEIPDHLRHGASHQLARDSLPNTLVESSMVEVFLVLLHHVLQVSFARDQEVAQSEHGMSVL
jgi:hypothetical protein